MLKVAFHQKAIILNHEGKFLALKASYKGLRWDLPGGGVEIPERAEIALHREIKEETGLEVEDIKPITLETAYNAEEDEYIMFAGYVCRALGDTINVSGEHTEYAWVSVDEWRDLDSIPYLKNFIEKWQNS
jgi:8-oxo-dGTP pyrophosphatase MutT (NUDIX family)